MSTHRSPAAFNALVEKRRAVRAGRKSRSYARILPGLARCGLLLVIFALAVATPLIGYSASSSDKPARGSVAPQVAAAPEAPFVSVADYAPADARGALDVTAGAGGYPVLAALFQSGESVATFDGDTGNCDIPKVTFNLGDTVCVRVSGAQLGEDGNPASRVKWAARTGSIVQSDDVTSESQTFRLLLPTDQTTTVTDDGGGSVVVDNRGLWKVYTASAADSSMRSLAYFIVRAPTSFVDLSLHQSVPSGGSQAAPGASSFFEIFLTNNGPNDAQNVVLTNATPAGTSFISFAESTAFGFTCSGPGAGPATCSAATLPEGATARFTFAYEIDSTAPGGSQILNLAGVTSTTPELDAADNTSALSSTVLAGAAADTCSLFCHENMVVTADAVEGGVAGAYVNYGSAAQVAGSCGAITSTPAPGSFFPVGANTVTVASESGGGSCSFTITVVGTPAPTITCPPDVTVTVADGANEANVNPGSPTTNPSTGVTVVGVRSDTQPQSDSSLPPVPVPLTDPYPVGTTTIRWTVTDAAGLSSSCTQSINVRPTARPALTISCPADVTAAAPAGECEAPSVSTGTPTTNLTDENVSIEGARSDGKPLSTPYPAGQTRITWTATDATSGNIASCIQTVNVTATHNTPPTLNVPADVEVETKSCSAIVDDELGVATGEANCGAGAVNITRTGVPPRFIFPTGTTVVTYRATDSAGNFVTGTQRVTVRELTAPTITAPADVQVFANASCQATGVALGSAAFGDNCSGSAVTNDAPATFPLGQTTVTWTVKDRSGNTATDTQVVTVVDNTAPSVEAPATLEASADANCQVAIPTVTVDASDNCTLPGDLTITQSPAAGTMVGLGTHTVTVTVKDAAGNTSSDTTAFTVADTTAPAVSAPADATYQCASEVPAAVASQATASDNCSTPTLSVVEANNGGAGTTASPLVITRTYTATDAAGNQASDAQTITVVDNTPPAVNCPANIVVTLPLNTTATSMPVSYPSPAASDNCGGSVNVSASHASGAAFPVGTTTVTVTATDDHGNSNSCAFTITVLYNFTGFFQPIENQPVLNQVKAGQSIPIKFSLSGNKGPDIFETGFPASGVVACNSNDPINEVEGTETAGGSTLQYDASSDRYLYTWKTEKAWANTCRQLVVQLNDGSFHRANFKFK